VHSAPTKCLLFSSFPHSFCIQRHTSPHLPPVFFPSKILARSHSLGIPTDVSLLFLYFYAPFTSQLFTCTPSSREWVRNIFLNFEFQVVCLFLFIPRLLFPFPPVTSLMSMTMFLLGQIWLFSDFFFLTTRTIR